MPGPTSSTSRSDSSASSSGLHPSLSMRLLHVNDLPSPAVILPRLYKPHVLKDGYCKRLYGIVTNLTKTMYKSDSVNGKTLARNITLILLATVIMGVAGGVLFHFFGPNIHNLHLARAALAGAGLGAAAITLLLGCIIEKKSHYKKLVKNEQIDERQMLSFEYCAPILKYLKPPKEIVLNSVKIRDEKGVYRVIDLSDGLSGKLILGSVPNKKTGDLERLHEAGITAVLSVNEGWEINNPTGNYTPCREADWNGKGIHFLTILAIDHVELNEGQMDEAAKYIGEELKNGNVYVHCRAGSGRSSSAIAAYLIKQAAEHGFLTEDNKATFVDDICKHIRHCKSSVTIQNKKASLLKYAQYRLNLPRP